MTFTKEHVEAVRRAYPYRWCAPEVGEDESDAACDALSDAPVVDRLFAWGAYEPYCVDVCGVPGAYFVRANEFDDLGVFSALDEARDARQQQWMGAGLFDTEEQAWAMGESNGWA